MLLHNNYKKTIYYIAIIIGLAAVLFSNPFLRYPYDAIAHLMTIDELYHHTKISTYFPEGRLLWHKFWAKLFTIFNIGSTDFFLRAKIIHIIQTYFSLFSIYYFSNIVIRNIFKDISPLSLKYLSVWSVIIWISIFATFSVYYQLVWSLWYSVNYQITLPLFWYITALTLVLFLEDTSLKKKIFFIIQILLISRFILQVHSMEFMYYLMYIFTFSLIYIDKTYFIIKKYYFLLILVIGSLFYFIKNYQPETSKIFNYLTVEKLPLLYETIMSTGHTVINNLSRSSASINELMYLIFYIGSATFLLFLWHWHKKESHINNKMFIFIIITSLFVLIPLYQFPAGIFSLIARTDVIHRIYYSSSLFILLPIFIYYISQTYNLKLKYINLLLLLSLGATFIFSKHNPVLSHNYYKNIQSIKNSFSEENSRFNLSKEQIDLIGKKLHDYELTNNSSKKEYYYARADISFVIKYIYRKKVYWEGRRKNPDYKKLYKTDRKNKQYYKVLFETPTTFPKYRPYL